MNTTLPDRFFLHIQREIDIDAPVGIAFDVLLEQMGPASDMPGGRSMPMKLEPWPGGRWYRDLGNNNGHLWGHVQVIKPPTLLEICGPLFMSYAAVSHLQYRLTESGRGTHLTFSHRALGEIAADHREGVARGWSYRLDRLREAAEQRNPEAAATQGNKR